MPKASKLTKDLNSLICKNEFYAMLAPMSVMQNHTSVQKQKEKDGTYDCVIKRDLNSPNIIFFDGEVSDDLQYFPTKIIQQNNGGNKA